MTPITNRVPFDWLPVSPTRRKLWRQRLQLAGLLGVLNRLSPVAVCELYWDDEAFTDLLQQFLWDSGWACMPLANSWQSQTAVGPAEGQAASLSDADSLSAALTKSVAMARDNEVFVVIANLFDRGQYVAKILPAIKAAVARHHRVVVLCTRPVPVFSGERRPAGPDVAQRTARREPEVLLKARAIEIDNYLFNLKRQLSRAGTKVAVASARNAVSLVLADQNWLDAVFPSRGAACELALAETDIYRPRIVHRHAGWNCNMQPDAVVDSVCE